MRALTAAKTGTEPAGMRKCGPSFRSIMVAWLMKNVESWANEMERAMVEAHTGKILMNDLNSSTCVTVHRFQRLFGLASSGFVTTAALSKNLQKSRTSMNHRKKFRPSAAFYFVIWEK